MSYYWFSYSHHGRNQGCINIQANTVVEAQTKAIELGIVPEYDDVESFEIAKPELPLNTLISPSKMREMKYKSVKSKKQT